MDVRAAAPPSFIGRHFFVEVPAPSPRAVRAREEYRRRQLDELQRVDTDSEPSSGSPEQQEDERSSEDDAEEVEELLRGPSRASAEAGQGREPEGEEDQDATEAPEEDGEDGAPSDVDMEGNASAQDNVPAATTSGELLQEEALHPVMHNGATPTVSSRPADATAGGSDIQDAMQLDPGVPSDGAAAGPLSAAAESILTSTSTLDATDAVPDVRVDTAATPEDPAGLASEQSAAVTHASIDGEHPAGKATPHQQLEATPSAEMTKSRSRSAGASSVASSSKKGGARGGSADGPDRIQSRLEPPGGQRKRLVRTGAVPASSSASPAAEAVSARGSPATASARSSSAYEILEKLPMDTGISKILNRDLNADGVYEYIVKLDNGSRVKVNDDLLNQFPDLLDDYDHAIREGQVDRHGFVLDSSDAEMDGGDDTGRRRKRRKRTNEDRDSEYGAPGPSGATAGEQDEAEDDEEDRDQDGSSDGIGNNNEDEEENASDLEAYGYKKKASRGRGKGNGKKGKQAATSDYARRSSREAARKPVNYAMDVDAQESEDESQLEDEEDQDDSDDMQVDTLARRSRPAAASSSRPRQRAPASSDDDDDDDSPFVTSVQSRATKARTQNSADSEEYDELDSDGDSDGKIKGKGKGKARELAIEEVHRQECVKCGASPASDLLAAFRRRKNGGRKKKNPEEELTEEDMLALGAFIECGTCCNVFHFSCLPVDQRATSLKTVYKKLLVANHAAADVPKPHLDTDSTFRIPSCHVCLKARGTRCFVCKDEAPKKDVTDYIDEVTPKEKEADGDKAGEDSSMQVDSAVEPARVKRSFSPVQETLLFRCQFCKRAAHYSCIPRGQVTVWQYTNDWTCGDCSSWDQPIDAVLAWRRPGTEAGAGGPKSPGKKAPGSPGKKRQLVELPDYKDPTEEAEHLVKFKDQSFRRVFWVPHAWLLAKWPQRLRNFCQKGPSIDIRTESVDHDDEDNNEEGAGANDQFTLAPSPNAIDDIPREWLTPDRILEVEYKRSTTSTRDFIPSAHMKTRISDDDPEESLDRIGRMYIKWQGLAYEAATWDPLPPKDDPQYPAFVKQYAIFLKFRSIKIARLAEKQMSMLDKARPKGQFDPLITQPAFITNGSLMDFQLEGVSWLYFNWWIKKGCILADEMGLGKTVQIISFLSILFAKENCLPFLVVVPNSTLANWQREFEKWAPPTMRVVPYYGSLASKRVIEQYELFTEGSVSEQKLRAHVVLTTYESLARAQNVFKRVPRWEALVVDEAQRLKGGGSGLLWKALRGQRIGHTVLLTGTPVNNNLDELFNLLHFIDPAQFGDLDGLHKKYETLTPELVAEVQGMAQPYFLRRTKEAVLDLPPLSEVIVPLGMSVLQKEVYKTVLSKNKDALASIYDSAKAKRAAKSNRHKIANVLMELRKTLCHPYLVEEALEHETDVTEADQHRNLVEASSKLTFLMDFLPKLKAKGHRVLLFSQFVIALNVIERFLEGERIKYVRLDGNTAQSVRQENIDRFNAPNSDITVFILSTRAGGVGINLATADTVIIHDADWNPFQDLQAISRAHRIGQKKKVLCFKLMVKDSCEEKIIEKGKKKMVLEQLIVDSLEKKRSGKAGAEEDDTPDNVESLLLFGAKALFEEKPGTSTANNITYSSKALDELLEKTEQEGMSEEAQAEKKQKSAEANKAFSYARVWERTQMEQEEEEERKQMEAQRGFWVKMFEEEQQKQKDEEIAEALAAGRGQRIRKKTNYNALAFGQFEGDDVDVASSAKKGKSQQPIEVDDDPEYEALDDNAGDSDGEYGEARDNVAERADARQEIRELDPAVQAAGKYKPNPDRAPPSHQPAQLAPGVMPPVTARYEIPRSVSPVDVKTRRQDLLNNLMERAKRVESSDVYKVLQRAVKAPTGTMQLTYMKQASAILRGMDPQVGF